jgi:hypothetical protein
MLYSKQNTHVPHTHAYVVLCKKIYEKQEGIPLLYFY